MDGTLKRSLPRGMVIEFMSTPGAGKTTLVPSVKEFFASNKFMPWTVVEAARPFIQRTAAGRLVNLLSPASLRGLLLWQAFYHTGKIHRRKFRSENPQLLESVENFQRQRPISSSDKQHVLKWFINLTGQYRFLKQHAETNDVLIFDEGFLHRVVQLFASEAETPDFKRIEAYLDMVPKPDLIIHPRASLDACLERVHQRGIWERFRGKEEAAVARFMHNSHWIVAYAVAYVRSKGWPILEIDNDGRSSSETLADLQNRLSAMYSSNGKSPLLTN